MKTTMRAMVYRRYGGPDVLEPAQLPVPKTHVDSVLVRVKAAGLNRADAVIQSGALDNAVEAYFPVVPGWDIAGVVERSGPAAPEFAPGDEVIGYIRGEVQRAHGALAEYVSADVRTLAPKPRHMGFAEAACLPLAGLTAYQAVAHALTVQAGETLLVHGAAGSVGSLAVQVARARGARVVGSASPKDHDYLVSLGADPVAYGEGMADLVLALVPRGVDAVLDTAGRGVLLATANAARPGARLASVAELGVPGSKDVFARLDSADLASVAALAEAGELKVRVGASFPLQRAAEAQRAYASGGIVGRVVVEIE